jgi:hypothetical protein
MSDSFKLSAVAETLSMIVSRYASARDDEGWLDVVADLHPTDQRDAARDLLDMLEARGFNLNSQPTASSAPVTPPAPPLTGNGLGSRLRRLSMQLVMVSNDPTRVRAIATGAMTTLAAEAQARDDAAIPAHLRVDLTNLPEGVVVLDQRRRATA